MKYENRKDRQLTDRSKEECEKACDGDDACRGFGYSAELKKCAVATDGLVWDTTAVLYLKAPNPDEENETMANIRKSLLPEQEKAANAESIARYLGSATEKKDKAKVKEVDDKAALKTKQIQEQAKKESEIKFAVK